jgi:hypothetical protein
MSASIGIIVLNFEVLVHGNNSAGKDGSEGQVRGEEEQIGVRQEVAGHAIQESGGGGDYIDLVKEEGRGKVELIWQHGGHRTSPPLPVKRLYAWAVKAAFTEDNATWLLRLINKDHLQALPRPKGTRPWSLHLPPVEHRHHFYQH